MVMPVLVDASHLRALFSVRTTLPVLIGVVDAHHALDNQQQSQ